MAERHRIDADWLQEHYPRMTSIEQLMDDYEREFGWRPRKTTLYNRAHSMGLRKLPVTGRGNRCERPVYWSKEPEMLAWMLEHDQGQRTDQLSSQFRERFGFSLSQGQINLFRAGYDRQVRQDGTRRGGRPLQPVGTERVSKDGYIVIKVRLRANKPMSKDNWMLKHVWAYQQAYGPVPEGHVVYFADGDKRNFEPENLVAVPRRLVGVMNNLKANGVEWHDRETLQAVMTMAELRIERNNTIASIEHVCPCCGRTFNNLGRRATNNIYTRVCPDCGSKGRKPSTGKRRKYDHDEIRRMHDAGMRNEQIADVFGCSPATVSNVIHRTTEKRKQERLRKWRAGA